MAMSESAPRAAVALKEPARKNEASSGTLRIMGLLLSSVSTGAPGRLDLEVDEGGPIFERWTYLHIVITRGGTPLDCFIWLSRQVEVCSSGRPHPARKQARRDRQEKGHPGVRSGIENGTPDGSDTDWRPGGRGP